MRTRRRRRALLLALALQPPGPGGAAEPAAAVDEVERYLLVDPPAHARLNEQRLYVERYAALAVALGRTLVLPRCRLHEHPPKPRHQMLGRVDGFTRGGLPLPAVESGEEEEEEAAAEAEVEGMTEGACGGGGCGAAHAKLARLSLSTVEWGALFNVSAMRAALPAVELRRFFALSAGEAAGSAGGEAALRATLVLVGLDRCGSVARDVPPGGGAPFNRALLPVAAVHCSDRLDGGGGGEGGAEADRIAWQPGASGGLPTEWDPSAIAALRRLSSSRVLAFNLLHRPPASLPVLPPLPDAMPGVPSLAGLKP